MSELSTIDEAIEWIKQGRIVIVVDDENRENEVTINNDRYIINSNGTYEKEKIPFLAHLKLLRKLFVDFPNIRFDLVYFIPVCLKPIQARIPLKNLSLSGILSKISIIFLSIKEKSPASTGTLI